EHSNFSRRPLAHIWIDGYPFNILGGPDDALLCFSADNRCAVVRAITSRSKNRQFYWRRLLSLVRSATFPSAKTSQGKRAREMEELRGICRWGACYSSRDVWAKLLHARYRHASGHTPGDSCAPEIARRTVTESLCKRDGGGSDGKLAVQK